MIAFALLWLVEPCSSLVPEDYSKLKTCEKWRLIHISLAKGKDGIIDLVAPLATSAGRPIGKKAAKAAILEATSTEKIQLSINKCLVDVSLISKKRRC
jgi:hypothetical protein